jgi:hypothetical protein
VAPYAAHSITNCISLKFIRLIETVIAKLKRRKSPGSDEIPAELIQAGGEILHSMIHKLINSIWNKEQLPDLWRGLVNTVMNLRVP